MTSLTLNPEPDPQVYAHGHIAVQLLPFYPKLLLFVYLSCKLDVPLDAVIIPARPAGGNIPTLSPCETSSFYLGSHVDPSEYLLDVAECHPNSLGIAKQIGRLYIVLLDPLPASIGHEVKKISMVGDKVRRLAPSEYVLLRYLVIEVTAT